MSKVYSSTEVQDMNQARHARNEVLGLLKTINMNAILESDKVRILCADIRLHFVDTKNPLFHTASLKACEVFKQIKLYKSDDVKGSYYQQFMNALDFKYDAGYGGQQLHGTIWFTDGTWATRDEYDGLEWWEHHNKPEIPLSLTSRKDNNDE